MFHFYAKWRINFPKWLIRYLYCNTLRLIDFQELLKLILVIDTHSGITFKSTIILLCISLVNDKVKFIAEEMGITTDKY